MAGGRPTNYKPEYAEMAAKICRLGATDKDLADFFNVCEATIYNWRNDYPEFLESLKQKELSDQEIVLSLHKRAKGYTRVVERATKDGVVPCMEEVPPDPTSMIFWLKNRQPKQWRDKQEHELSGTVSIIPEFVIDRKKIE